MHCSKELRGEAMGHLRLLLAAGMTMGMAAAYGAELAPVCGAAGAPAEGGCWQPLENRRSCHVWNPNPQPDESATFEGRMGCRNGKLSGTGKLTWMVREDGELRSSTNTGPYSEGKTNGRFVLTGPGGFRAEGEYVEGQPHGHWVNTRPHGTEGIPDRFEGSWVDGIQQGEWTLIDYDEDGKLIEEQKGFVAGGKRHGEWVEHGYNEEGKLTHEHKGAYFGGKRHGDWILESTEYWWATYRERSIGAYDHGKRHGAWVRVRYAETDDGTHVAYERQEGPYVENEKHGPWVEIEHNHDVTLRNDGADAHGDEWTRSEGSYLQGEKDGTWSHVVSDGRKIVETFSGGQWSDDYTAWSADGAILVSATVENGEVTALRLPQAAVPQPPEGASNRSPVLGAFGIAFGGDVDQLAPLGCEGRHDDEPRHCLTMALEMIDRRVKRFSPRPPYAFKVNRVPAPITRGQGYSVSVSPWFGISRVSTSLSFESEEACRQQDERLRGLLADKYGKCTDYSFPPTAPGRTPIGQCDSDGLPTIKISLYCNDDNNAVFLNYEILDPSERESLVAVRRKKGEISASEL